MKKLLMVFALVWIGLRVSAQAVNPQNTFSNAVSINSPSLWLNFNDATTSFKDSVSGLSFGSPSVSYGGTPTSATVGGNVGGTISIVNPAFPVSGTLQYIYFKANTTPTTTQTFLLLSGTGPSFTIVSSFTATVAATTSAQMLIAGVNFTAQTVTAGQHMGNWVASGVSSGYNNSGPGVYYLLGQSTLPSGPTTYTALAGYSYSFAGGVVSGSLASVQQPGFDNTNNANFSAKFPYNSAAIAPNTTLGSDMEWNTPWSMLIHINKLNWDHTGKLILASKGDLNGTNINNSWWQLYIQANSANPYASQVCFARQSPAPYTTTVGGPFLALQTACSPTIVDAVPNGFNYDMVVEDSGTGKASAISMWINGLQQATLTSDSPNGFGGLTAVVTTGGTGYTAAPTLSAVGGGANCRLNGGTSASVSGGAVTSVVIYSSGCTSTPTISVTGGGGAGAVVTATSYPMKMNSPTQPLVVAGYVNSGVLYGQGGTDIAQNPLYVDEFAIIPGNLTSKQITNLFNQTKFYQGLLYPGLLANPPLVIFNTYGCGPDFSGDQTLAMTIGAAQAGLIRLIGITNDDGNTNGYNSAGWFREVLDQAGMNDVPQSIYATANGGPNIGGCPASLITAYNANVPQNPSVYPSATTVMRTLFAKYPTTPIYVLQTQTMNSLSDFLLSPADSISSLTGAQMNARNYANGGWINAFEGNFANTPSAYLSVLNNIGNYPMYFEGGTPAPGGPGIYNSRTVSDPMYQTALTMSVGDAVSGWTNQNLAQILSPYFLGGALITASGGTGYGNTTQFTSAGGGPYCNVTGIMVSASGAPTGFRSSWYGTLYGAYDGLGYGCTPAVFTATGSGTNLTVSAITCCQIGPTSTPPVITIGDTISGAGIPAGTTIVSQTSGPKGGPGVYVTSVATTASSATVTRYPTIVLTAPTGTGVTLTVTNGIFPKTYEGSATNSYAVWPNRWGYSQVFTWFQNSLQNPPTTGAPRPY